MEVSVKTIWGAGFVSVHQKYIDGSIKNEEDLIIKCKGNKITIPLEKLKVTIPRNKDFTDRFGGETYRLYDFFWKSFKESKNLIKLL